ncbi:MAG TPA: nucleotide pyrophosphohydrolase [Methanocorpusculum sp.]|nr:nucleotide pyrophosphohydrolase [Methanocorpusculum sp.]HJJ40328.1 nucleotide pyrophosphohydrolase [Methanocorpusculum sp.]HJJ49755.1 nucleotide pyrophosphohydrolase [Methanocorpusculum sp.]HJJ57587.1 nucleotide pyrophosphohydrolase [Methanocorpusculum sp.]HJJ95908.1 nucleotide pyrophosphohydrolase [Methanocorpusculum sp.]
MNKTTVEKIRKFSAERDWEQFHTPGNLAKSISIEANELLECFQWNDTEFDRDAVKEELADVLIYCQYLLDKLELNADDIVAEKISRNELKYPIEKAKGTAEKYTSWVNE